MQLFKSLLPSRNHSILRDSKVCIRISLRILTDNCRYCWDPHRRYGPGPSYLATVVLTQYSPHSNRSANRCQLGTRINVLSISFTHGGSRKPLIYNHLFLESSYVCRILVFGTPRLRAVSFYHHRPSKRFTLKPLSSSEFSILCSNRDEYMSRPTAPAHFHSFEKLGQPEDVGVGTVLSGRDLRAGGSWLGLNRTGRVAVLYARRVCIKRSRTQN